MNNFYAALSASCMLCACTPQTNDDVESKQFDFEAQSTAPDSSGIVETTTAYSPAEVQQLIARAESGNLQARRNLWLHYQFIQDDVRAETQFEILLAARHPEALQEMSSRVLFEASRRDDQDVMKLQQYRQGLSLRREALSAQSLSDPTRGPWIAAEIDRLEAIQEEK